MYEELKLEQENPYLLAENTYNVIFDMRNRGASAFGSTDSATSQFYSSLASITVGISDPGSYLTFCSTALDRIVEILNMSNPALASSWSSINNTLLSIDKKVLDILYDLIKSMTNYAETSMANENQAKKYAEEVIDKSEDILSRLNEI